MHILKEIDGKLVTALSNGFIFYYEKAEEVEFPKMFVDSDIVHLVRLTKFQSTWNMGRKRNEKKVFKNVSTNMPLRCDFVRYRDSGSKPEQRD